MAMRLNSPEAKRLASRVFRASGSDWSVVRANSHVREDGIRVVNVERLARNGRAAARD